MNNVISRRCDQLNKNPSARQRTPPHLLLAREPLEAPQASQATVIALGCPPVGQQKDPVAENTTWFGGVKLELTRKLLPRPAGFDSAGRHYAVKP